MRWITSIGAVALLLLLLSVNAFATGVNGATSANAIPLPGPLTATGTLTGLAQGAFTFYTFDYPGDGSVGTVSLDVNPTDSNTTNAVGVNLYQSGATLLSMNALGTTSGINSGTFSSTVDAPVLVEVYNYLPAQVATYSFSINGVTGRPVVSGAQGLPVAVGQPGQGSLRGGQTADSATPLSASLSASGVLMGNAVGRFAYYSFNYAGDNHRGTVTLTINPTNAGTANAVGINLYQSGSTLLSMNAISPIPGTNSATFSSTTTGPVLVQVYNYLPGQAADYTFAISGTTPVSQASPTQTPTTAASTSVGPIVVVPTTNNGGATPGAAVLLPASLSALGSLPGSANGAFAYYTFNSPSAGKNGTVTLTVMPGDMATANAVGVHLYQGGTALLSMNAVGTTFGTNSGTFTTTSAEPILIQVYNYLPGQNATFAFAITGLSS